MPWAASVVYLRDTPDARAVLLADGRLRGHVYAVDAARVEWAPQVEPGAGPLLALRSPVRPKGLADVVDGLDWTPLTGALPTQLGFGRPALNAAATRIAPTAAQLDWFEELAARVAGPVAWYLAEATASDPEAELAWVLDWGGAAKVGDEALERAPVLYTRKEPRFVAVRASGTTFSRREPLGAALLHLGVRLEGPWFTPHRPDFDWGACRVG